MKVEGFELPDFLIRKIEQRYNPESFITAFTTGNNIFIAYENFFENLCIVYKGFLIVKDRINLSGFASAKKLPQSFSFLDKKNAVKHYLNIDTDDESVVQQWFDKLLWLKEHTTEENQLIDEIIF